MVKRKRNQKGMFLVSSFLVVSVITTFALALFLKNVSIYRTIEHAQNRVWAFHLAESGLDRAIVELEADPNYTGQGFTAFGSGGYEALVETPDPVNNPTVRRITATGHVPTNNAASYAYERRQVVAYVNLSFQSNTDFSIFTNDSIQLSGNAGTDSYNSRNGPYDSGRAGTNGDMGTNTIQAHNIAMSGNVRIQGDVVVGPGGNPSQVIVASGNARIDGTTSAASSPRVLVPVRIPSGLTNQGSLRLQGNDRLILTGGTYWFSSIEVKGNAQLSFSSPATVYVSGDVKISGDNVGSVQNLPPQLTVNVAGSHEVSLSGNGNFYGTFYAPQSGLMLSGNAQVYGSVTGETLQQSGNAMVHFDEALKGPTNGASGSSARMLAWTES